MTKFKITLKPINQVIEVDAGKNLLESLRENDIYIKSSCGGVASCSDCICKVMTGEDNLESPPFAELKLLGNVFHITKERLMCQTKIIGDITLDISAHDRDRDEVKMRNKMSKNAPKKPVTKVRSREEFNKIKEERFQERSENQVKDQAWEKHWEKETDPNAPKKPKALGGGKRPKFFKVDESQAENFIPERRSEKHTDKRTEKRSHSKIDDNTRNDKSTSSKEFKKFRD